MGIDSAHYHAWNGKLRAPWRATSAVVRTTLVQALRRKAYWFIYAIGVLQFLFYWAVIYALTQMDVSPQIREGLFDWLGFSAAADDPQNTGYVDFMEQQGVVVMILLAFCGSTIIGSDFREGALPFYLSRRIDRRHYIAGKILAVAALIWLLTVVPATLLFLEFGMFTTSLDYWSENWRVVPAILGYGAVLGLVLGIWITALSAYLQKLAPIAVMWSSLFILLSTMSVRLREASDDVRWLLLNPWRDIRLAGRFFFGLFRFKADEELSIYAAAILAVSCTIALVALVRRVRAVEVAT